MHSISQKLYVLVEALIFITYNATMHPMGGKKLSATLDVPPRYLEPLLQALVRANILRSIRGPRGGYMLARERERIGLDEILLAIEQLRSEKDSGIRLSHANEVIVQPLFEDARGAYIKELGRYSLEDICIRAGEEEMESIFHLGNSPQHPRYDYAI